MVDSHCGQLSVVSRHISCNMVSPTWQRNYLPPEDSCTSERERERQREREREREGGGGGGEGMDEEFNTLTLCSSNCTAIQL